MTDLKFKVISGVGWSALDKWGGCLFDLILMVVLARILSPEAFGLVALGTIFTSFMNIFLEQGLMSAIVQRKDITKEHLDSAFLINIVFGIFFTVLGIIFSPIIAKIFNENELQPIIAWLSLGFIIFAFSTVQQAILKRDLDFKGLAKRSVLSKFVAGVAAIIFAITGFGVWSLVIKSLVTGFVAAIVLWSVSDWRPTLTFSFSHFKELFNFGINILGTKIIDFFDKRADNIIIGYFLGATVLGYYTIAFRIVFTIVSMINALNGHVLFSTFSRIQSNLPKLRSLFYRTTELMNILIFPLFLGVIVLSPQLVVGIFGEKWHESIILVQLLSLTGIALTVLGFSGNLTNALNKPTLQLMVRTVISISRVIALIIGIKWGVVGITVAYVITTYIVFVPLNLWLPKKLIDINLNKYAKLLIYPVLSSLLMILFIFFGKYLFDMYFTFGHLGILITFVISGGALYTIAIRLFMPSTFKYFLNLMFEFSGIQSFKQKPY